MNRHGIEAFVLMSVGIIFVIVRMIARINLVGVKKLQADDYLMVVAGAAYAVSAGLVYLTATRWEGLANNGLTQEQRRLLYSDPRSEEYRYRVNGSKAHVAGWQTYVFVLWSVKAAWLVFYSRLMGVFLSRRHLYRCAFILGSTYVVIVLTLLLSCRPLRKYWQIYPDPGASCLPATSNSNIITVLVLNVMTDLYLMAIPIPMILKASLSWIKKIGLVLLFSGGIFVTAAGIVRGILMMEHPDKAGDLSGTWALRELFVAMVMSNMPFIVPLVRQWYRPARKLFRGCPPGGNGIYANTSTTANKMPAPMENEHKRSTSLERTRTAMAAPPVDVDIDDSDVDPYDERFEVAPSVDRDNWDQEERRIEPEAGCSTTVN